MPFTNDPRLRDSVRRVPYDQALEQKPTFVLQGYPDDEGVSNGGGRAGAKGGPAAIRQELLKLTPSLFASDITCLDVGDIAGADLAARHAQARRQCHGLLKKGHRVISLGGGHDYGYADGAAFLSAESARPLILNFDAHLDVRPPHGGLNSGTSFYRLLEEFEDFDFAEIGIQSHCNAKAHWEYATAKGARILTYDEWILSGRSFHEYVMNRLESWLIRPRPTYLSLDIDVFAASSAPGCSAAQPLGITPHEFYPLLLILLERLDVRLFGVYETAPALDDHAVTARLAAHLLHRFLYSRTLEKALV